MLHVNNISHVLTNGITHKNSPNRNPNFVPIGEGSIIDKRTNHLAIIDNGGQLGFGYIETITLGDLIPFYFGPRSPMLYKIEKGGDGVNKVHPKDIVYIVTNVEQIVNSGIKYYFTDGHAIPAYTKFYNSDRVNDISTLVDIEAAWAKYWKSDTDLDLKRRKEAEFLVQNDIPPQYILGYVCYNEETKEKLVSFGIPENRIEVKSNYYFT